MQSVHIRDVALLGALRGGLLIEHLIQLALVTVIYLLGNVNEDALDPAARLCRGLREVHHVLFSFQAKSFLKGDLSEVLHIGFIAHKDRDHLS